MLNNPFAKVTVGSTVDASGRFDVTALSQNAAISRLNQQFVADMCMLGQSDTSYTTRMNHASISMSGSYGFSGLSKASAAFSAYAGLSTANSMTTTSVGCQIVQCNAIEYINFDEMTPLTMLSALSAAPRTLAQKALDRYNDLVAALNGRPLIDALAAPTPAPRPAPAPAVVPPPPPPQDPQAKGEPWSPLSILRGLVHDRLQPEGPEPDASQPAAPTPDASQPAAPTPDAPQPAAPTPTPDLKAKVDAWASAVRDFRDNYGEGIVVDIAWGGAGTCTLTINNMSSARSWKYGAAANFSYSGPASSFSVAAAFDASGSDSTSSDKVSCTARVFGACVKEQTNAWVAQLNDKALQDIQNMAPLTAPGLPDDKIAPPSAPDFQTPKEPEPKPKVDSLTKSVLTDLGKIDAYNRAKALWDKNYPDGPPFHDSLDEFLTNAAKKPDAAPARNLRSKVVANRVSTVAVKKPAAVQMYRSALEPSSTAGHTDPVDNPAAIRMYGSVLAPSSVPSSTPSSTGDYYPVGMWIAPWSDIFPWLATGLLNEVDTSEAEAIARFRVMQQDLLTLGRIYTCAANLNVNFTKEPNFTPRDLNQLANDFYAQLAFLGDPSKITSGHMAAHVDQAFAQLGPRAQAIYKRWDEVPILRCAELGLGVVKNNLSLSQNESSWNTQYDYFNQAVADYLRYTDGWHSEFNASGQPPNYDVFAANLKVFPIVLPSSGDILAFGPGERVMGTWKNVSAKKLPFLTTLDVPAVRPDFFDFSSQDGHFQGMYGDGVCAVSWDFEFMTFRPDADDREQMTCLQNADASVKLYPIPLSAAAGGGWRGNSLGASLASDNDLIAKLQEVADSVESAATKWSSSADALPDDWSPSDPIFRKRIRRQYYGLIPEPGKVEETPD